MDYDEDDDIAHATFQLRQVKQQSTCEKLCSRPKGAVALNFSSLFIFSGENAVRIFIYNVTRHKVFEAIVIFLILANCVFLALDDPTSETTPDYQVVAEYFFTAAFTLELFLKVFSLGLVGHDGSYLRSGWNVLDCIIVGLSYLSFAPGVGNFTALRTLRVLRPLRSLNAFPGMKIIVNGLIHSVVGLGHVMILLSFLFGIFGILGLQLMKGLYRNKCFDPHTNITYNDVFCKYHGIPGDGQQYEMWLGYTCPNSTWKCVTQPTNPSFHGYLHFDNIGSSSLVLFTLITFEDWTGHLDIFYDVVGQPMIIYMFAFLIMGSYFMTNLALAVINEKFVEAQEETLAEQEEAKRKADEELRKSMATATTLRAAPEDLTESQMVLEEERQERLATPEPPKPSQAWITFMELRDWIHMKTEGFPLPQEPPKEIASDPDSKAAYLANQAKMAEDAETPVFQIFIIFCIVLNTALIAMQHHQQPQWVTDMNKYGNIVLTVIFAIEMVIKLVGMGPILYCMDGFNILDGLVVIVSIVELSLSGSSTVSVFRALRLLRVLKFVKSVESLRKIVRVMLSALKSTGYLNMIILLYMFIAALMGMQLFGGKFKKLEIEDGEPIRTTFDSFYRAFLAIFQILTRDEWITVMINGARSSHPAAVLFFIALVLIGDFLILNLFLAILIGAFEADANNEEEEEAEDGEEPGMGSTAVGKPQTSDASSHQQQLRMRRKGTGMSGAGTGLLLITAVQPDDIIRIGPPMARQIKRSEALKRQKTIVGFKEANVLQAHPSQGTFIPSDSQSLASGGIVVGEDGGFTQALPTVASMQFPAVNGREYTGLGGGTLVGTKPVKRVTLDTSHLDSDIDFGRMAEPTAEFSGFGYGEDEDEEMEIRQPTWFSVDGSEALGSPFGERSEPCEKCANFKQVPLDSPPLIPKVTQSGLHTRMCETMSVRAAKEAVLKKLFDYVNQQLKLGSLPTQDKVETLVGQAWSSGLLLSEHIDAFFEVKPSSFIHPDEKKEQDIQRKQQAERETPETERSMVVGPEVTEEDLVARREHSRTESGESTGLSNEMSGPHRTMTKSPTRSGENRQVWLRIKEAISKEKQVLDLHVGEEQVGRSLIAYVTGNVPKDHTTNGGWALGVFGPENPLRLLVSEMVQTWLWDTVILGCIIVSSALLAIDNPREDQTTTKYQVLDVIDITFTWIFTTEMMCKVVAYGFIQHKGAYIRDGWNVLDFLIVIVSLTAFGGKIESQRGGDGAPDIGFLKVLRALRALRPLRVITKNRGLKIVVVTLFQSIKGISNVSLIALLNYLIFGILGVQFFSGKLYSCTDADISYRVNCTGNYTTDDGEVMDRLWLPYDHNFDNLGYSMLTLLEVSSMEWWVAIMYSCIDAVSYDVIPQRDHQPVFGLFFLVFIIIASFFLLNMFVGVVISNFNTAKTRMDGLNSLNDEQKMWVETQRLMLNFRPNPLITHGNSRLSKKMFKIVTDFAFEVIVAICILGNVVVLAMDFYGASATYTFALQTCNEIFALLFLVEAGMKLIGMQKTYFHDGWNRFDLFLVVISIIGFIFSRVDADIGFNVSVVLIFRTFRIMRILRLVRQAKKVQMLLETLWYSLPSLANIGAFMFLLFFIYAILGMQIFYAVDSGEKMDNRYANFHNFWNAMGLLLRFMTVTDWNQCMRDCMAQPPFCKASGPDKNCGNPWVAPIYFISFLLFAAFVLTNLFIAIILDNFNTTMRLDKSQAEVQLTDLQRFISLWPEYDPDATLIIPTHRLQNLLAKLGPPLGLAHVGSKLELLKTTAKYRIPEHGGYVHFVETLIPIARRQMVPEGALSLRDVRDHEEQWRQNDPDLAALPILRYRFAAITIELYFASTFIQAAHRRRLAHRRCERIREAKQETIRNFVESQKRAAGGTRALLSTILHPRPGSAPAERQERSILNPLAPPPPGDRCESNRLSQSAIVSELDRSGPVGPSLGRNRSSSLHGNVADLTKQMESPSSKGGLGRPDSRQGALLNSSASPKGGNGPGVKFGTLVSPSASPANSSTSGSAQPSFSHIPAANKDNTQTSQSQPLTDLNSGSAMSVSSPNNHDNPIGRSMETTHGEETSEVKSFSESPPNNSSQCGEESHYLRSSSTNPPLEVSVENPNNGDEFEMQARQGTTTNASKGSHPVSDGRQEA